MSAYVVDRESIAYLVTAALQLPERHDSLRWHHAGESRTLHAGDYPAASRLGQMLWDENIRSVCFRYDEPYAQVDRGKLPGTNGESYEFDFAAGEALTTSIEPAVCRSYMNVSMSRTMGYSISPTVVSNRGTGPTLIIWCTAGVNGIVAPAILAMRGLQHPQAMITYSASMTPRSVRTALT